MARIIILNLGSTSSKGAVYENLECLDEFTLRHSAEELKPFKRIMEQVDFRQACVETWLSEHQYRLEEMDVFCVRGGLVKPLPSGIYEVTDEIVDEVMVDKYGAHSSSIGMVIGRRWAKTYQKPAIFANAPITDELQEVARFTGLKGVYRRSLFHALNQKQIALEYAKSVNKSVNELNLIVCHLGGGFSVGAHRKGKVVDVSNALDGEGPFSPERAGALSNFIVLDLVEQMQDIPAIKRILGGKSGLISHLGTNSMMDALKMAETDAYAKQVIDAMIYQITKEVGAMAAVLEGKVDQILITGGLAYNQNFVQRIMNKLTWIQNVSVYPGEDELFALASAAVRFINHEEEPGFY